MPAKKQPKPEPISLNIVCSICDEPWHLHKEVNGEVSTLECIRLLKAKRYTYSPTIVQQPYGVPIQPVIRPWYNPPYWQTITVSSTDSNQAASSLTTTNYSTMTPTVALASAAA
jgi:hypothetical protein